VATGAVELFLLAVAWPLRGRWVPRLVALERARLRVLLGYDTEGNAGKGTTGTGAGTGAGTAGAGYLALRALTGVIGGYLTSVLFFVAALFLGGAGWAVLAGDPALVPLEFPGVHLTTDSRIIGLAAGILLLALGLLSGVLTVVAERWLADRFLGPGTQERMRRRIAELTATRSGIVRAVDDERRRIERDLHDGVQQRGVALAMLLGRARHTPEAAQGLLDQAYAESRRLLDELRSVAWRIYPTALDELGLRAALAGVAERADVPVTVHYRLAERLATEVETALYFVAREAITNAVKHAGARDIVVVLTEDERVVRVVVSDDGVGGADPAGGGLSGLARRVFALDGTFEVTDSAGGGTRVCATLPREVRCG